MAEELSRADRSSLAAERGPVNMSILAALILEPGAEISYDALCRRVEERIHLLPRYRQRIEQPALGLTAPVWTDDEHFDVRWHVRRTALPHPGSTADLAAFVGAEASRRMDRSHPLWELHLVEGLSRGRTAVVPKMHHALLDGMAALGVGMILLDPTPEPLPVEAPAEPWTPRPFAMRRQIAQLAASQVTRAQKLAFDTAFRALEATPRSTAGDLWRATELLTELARLRLPPPELPINRPISPNRSYAMGHAPLAGIKIAARAVGATVNDVVLAAVSGMLARYLREAGVDPAGLPREPVALVPVSVRREDDAAGGNRFSLVFIDLPAAEEDPRRRIALINERTTAAKRSARVAAGSLLLDAAGFGPPLLASMLARTQGDRAPCNIVVSNIPGPQFPFYLGGARVLGAHPVIPLNPASQGLSVGVLSYDGMLCFGLTADRDLDPPVERAADALEHALTAILSIR